MPAYDQGLPLAPLPRPYDHQFNPPTHAPTGVTGGASVGHNGERPDGGLYVGCSWRAPGIIQGWNRTAVGGAA
ncbi:hypothetical protein AALO_G00028780 [Alosa alosa]|uniref:Uncharacterized protein n=1 Tax=Alosa alosa TaxID=278164 RepID=A0AAV6HB83_9TELE|nr:hypothetical protein AALO_G00028780 [Alosa alosa]